MKHFARLNPIPVYDSYLGNVFIVENVETIDDHVLDDNGIQIEEKGISFCKNLHIKEHPNAIYKQCSDGSGSDFRNIYPGIGYYWSQSRNAFIPPRPSFGNYFFDESILNWIQK